MYSIWSFFFLFPGKHWFGVYFPFFLGKTHFSLDFRWLGCPTISALVIASRKVIFLVVRIGVTFFLTFYIPGRNRTQIYLLWKRRKKGNRGGVTVKSEFFFGNKEVKCTQGSHSSADPGNGIPGQGQLMLTEVQDTERVESTSSYWMWQFIETKQNDTLVLSLYLSLAGGVYWMAGTAGAGPLLHPKEWEGRYWTNTDLCTIEGASISYLLPQVPSKGTKNILTPTTQRLIVALGNFHLLISLTGSCLLVSPNAFLSTLILTALFGVPI